MHASVVMRRHMSLLDVVIVVMQSWYADIPLGWKVVLSSNFHF